MAIAFSSCTINPVVELYNHADSTIQLEVGDDRYTIEPEHSESFGEPVNETRLLSVCLDPREYYRVRLRGQIRLQLDGDGRMRILKPDEEFPLAPDRPQPDRYPITPERAGSC